MRTIRRPVTAPADPGRRALSRWTVSLAATAASTFLLDIAATAAGLALASVPVLTSLPLGWLATFLGGSYLIWGLGLRANLTANGDLLEQTGTSTNVVSKATYDLSVRWGRGPRLRRVAAASGYLATEIAKEAPYYVGAFGATLLLDSVTARQALVFLIGANIGAAGYELALSRLTWALLGRRYARFETDWVPRDYLAEYYTKVEPDELETIAFLVGAIRHAPPDRPVLFFGVGPTMHHVFLAANVSSEIHLGDYLPANLAEIRRWIDRDPSAHDWRPFVRYTLECEGVAFPTEVEVTAREELTRSKIARLFEVDGRRPPPEAERYATVISAYCADSATPEPASWARFMRNIMGTVAPGGLFLTAALRNSHGYVVGGKRFPSAGVDEEDLRGVFERVWGGSAGSVQVHDLADDAEHGYSGIVLAWARRPDVAIPRELTGASSRGGKRPTAPAASAGRPGCPTR